MPGQHKKRRAEGWDYAPLFRRIEEAFSPEEMTDQTLKDYIDARTPGMDALAEQLSQTSIISSSIEESEDIKELRGLKKEVRKLDIHIETLISRIDEKIIALSITLVEDFAKEKGIELTEKVIGNIEIWKDEKQYVVIRKNGSFRSWKKL